jgi:hypothetical protein
VVPAIVEVLYAASTLVLVGAGLTMVGMGLQAYVQTSQTAMLYLAVGFSLAVAGAAGTMVGAFLTGFGGDGLLLVNSGFTASGFLFVLYSLVTYE